MEEERKLKAGGQVSNVQDGGMWTASSETGGKKMFSGKGKGHLVFEMSILGF